MIKHSAPVLIALCMPLAACGSEGPGAEEVFEEAVEGEGAAIPLQPGPDFASLQLGPKIQGPEGEEVASKFEGAGGQLRSYVACPAEAESCEPEQLDGDTAYTYVHEVTPGTRTSVFRTIQPAYGFTGTAGFDHSQEEAAIGGDSELVVRCVNGALIWAVNGGEGWTGPITVYWQSTLPPAGPAVAYQLITEGDRAPATGPFPAEGSTEGCG